VQYLEAPPPATDPEQKDPGPVLYGRYRRGRAAISTDKADRERRRIPRGIFANQTGYIDRDPLPSPVWYWTDERTDGQQAGDTGAGDGMEK